MVMGKDEIGQHTVQQYNEDLENLHRSVLGMGQLVLAQLDDGIAALASGDKERATRVVRRDVDVNTLEVHLDKECQRILVRRQPAAGDLRLIFAVIKTVTDLERIGDHAKNIAEYVIYMVHGEDVRHISEEERRQRLAPEAPSARGQDGPGAAGAAQ